MSSAISRMIFTFIMKKIMDKISIELYQYNG